MRARSSGDSTSGRSASTSVSFVAWTSGIVTPNALSVRATASSWSDVTTGLPRAIASIANSPYQPALSWSTTMSARS